MAKYYSFMRVDYTCNETDGNGVPTVQNGIVHELFATLKEATMAMRDTASELFDSLCFHRTYDCDWDIDFSKDGEFMKIRLIGEGEEVGKDRHIDYVIVEFEK